jgi:hypothetical protein
MIERAQAIEPDLGGIFFEMVGLFLPFWNNYSI